MIDLLISSCDLMFEELAGTTGGSTCCDKCDEQVCICNTWVATCSRCYMPIYGGDEYGSSRHGLAPNTYETFSCEGCMRQEAA